MILLPGNEFKEEGRAMYISGPKLLYVTGDPTKLFSYAYPLMFEDYTNNGFYDTPEEDRWACIAEHSEKKIGDYDDSAMLFQFIVTFPSTVSCFYQMDIATDFNYWWYVKKWGWNCSGLAIAKSSFCDKSLSLYYRDRNVMLDMVSTMIA